MGRPRRDAPLPRRAQADAEFTFDVDLALSQSEDNPVYYVQYAHARICSVLQQAGEKGFAVPNATSAISTISRRSPTRASRR